MRLFKAEREYVWVTAEQWEKLEEAAAEYQARRAMRKERVRRWLRLGCRSAAMVVVLAIAGAAPAFAATASGTAPGLSVFSGIDSWISQYGTAGAPVAVSLGGLLFAVEHHQQRTGNAIRAKGYIFSAVAGLIVISLAATIVSATGTLSS